MGLYDSYNKVSGIRRVAQNVRDERNREKSKIRLENATHKKFETSLIGTLDSIEQYFGYLWGRDLPKEERTNEHRQMYKRWMNLRTEILDKGHFQLRSLVKELEEYTVDWNGKVVKGL